MTIGDKDILEVEKHGHNKIKIGVSGAAETGHCGVDALDKAKALGAEIVKQGAVLVTGATTGFPLWSCMGAKEAHGISIGLSPAQNERDHVENWRLPIDYMDLIIYTGFGFPGRDLLFTRSCDAVLIGCGRIGTFHEFTIAFEDGKPVGVLEGSWTAADQIKEMIEKSGRPGDKVIFDNDPAKLVARILKMVEEDKQKIRTEAPQVK
ncbi:MAG: hypothetical protein WCQ32_00955 [bacterium]